MKTSDPGSRKAVAGVVAVVAAALSVCPSPNRHRAVVAAPHLQDSWDWAKRAKAAILALPRSQAAHPVLGWVRCETTGPSNAGRCQSVTQEQGLVLRADWHIHEPSAWRMIVEVDSAGADLECADITPLARQLREARTTVSRIALCETGEAAVVLLDHSPDVPQNSTYRVEYMSHAFLGQNPSYLSALFDSPAPAHHHPWSSNTPVQVR